jgi:hypothetical protein
MYKRAIILLKIKDSYYKFLSIFYSDKDESYFLYNHLIKEEAPLLIAEPFHLLKTVGKFFTHKLKRTVSENGNLTHISIHPLRIYLKKRSSGGREEHLLEEMEPQPFNKEGFRLHCIFTPPLPIYLPSYDVQQKKRADTELVVFNWDNQYCPQVSLYELNQHFDIAKAKNILSKAEEIKIISSGGIHPKLCLHLRATNGDPGVWGSNFSIFGKIIKKRPVSKSELERIISYNGLNFDISSLPDEAIITDYKFEE